MPYPVAHVAAAIPLRLVLGSLGVPSALVIGSIAPDLWYLVFSVDRAQAHSLGGVLWFCLPVSLLLYAAFHLLFKHPLLALMPPSVAGRLNAWVCRGMPAVRWHAVVISLLSGILVHLAWDALTHPPVSASREQLFIAGGVPIYLHQVLQHASTALGVGFLLWWFFRKLRGAPIARGPETAGLAPPLRAAVLSALVVPAMLVFCDVVAETWLSPARDLSAMREVLRAAAVTGVSVLGLGLVAYCVLWKVSGSGGRPAGP